MTGSTRLSSTSSTVSRAPYSVPQTAAPSFSHAQSAEQANGVTSHRPAPFVPREFRMGVRPDVTLLPVMERAEASSAAVPQPEPASSISLLFNDDVAPAPDFSAFVESHGQEPEQVLEAHHAVDQDLDVTESTSSGELPWIDAFAVDVPEPEESWPLGEAGRRLDELTQSLSSMDATRERQQAAVRQSAEPQVKAEENLPMWNEEEWIDIMPTLSVEQMPQENLERSAVHEAAHNQLKADSLASEASTSPVDAESAARALEGLAQRVRAGEVQVPAFPAELGQEAMLAGLLASMLGWRQ